MTEFESIPSDVIDTIQARYNFFYGHTSHGSQIMTGLDMVYAEDASYAEPYFYEISDDLGHTGDLSWAPPTRCYLDTHPGCNAVMWSWCGGCSDNTEAGINAYLNEMNDLESEYPGVVFLYMTGHLDGGGTGGTLYTMNNLIRAYCVANDKILFDFADIESWDPDGIYYPDESDDCDWCSDWCAVNTCPTCGSCAHSHCFNCYQKGKAFWWMMARVSGWETETAVQQGGDHPISTLFQLEGNRPNPFNPLTEISFTLTGPSNTVLEIFNAAGRRMTTLVDAPLAGGEHRFTWNGRDGNGDLAGSGIYFYRLRSGNEVETKKMTLIR